MNCPRCTTEPLLECVREAVNIDVCNACRGIWLDRGELEKLIARSQDDRHYRRGDDDPPSSDGPRRGRKRSWLDIFD